MMSAKKFDSKGRFRSKTVSFRMSPEENELLDSFVRMSGYTKQDYLINRALQSEIVVNGNPRIYKALRNQMIEILNELKQLEVIGTENDELILRITQINTILNGFGK